MHMTRFALIFSSPLLAVAVAAQVAVDRPIELTGVNAEQHQVTGVPSSLAPDAILAANIEGSGVHRSAQAAISTSWTVDVPALSSAPIPGTHLMVLAPAGSVGDVELSVNGAGPYPLVTGPGENFAPVDLSEGTPLSIVFDGSVFHVMNGGTYERKPCATGTIAVNEQFCVEPNERGGLDFFQAAIVCGNLSLRLCTWAEYITACTKRVELGLNNMTNNWEWVDDATNEDGSARVSGNNQCGSSGNGLVTGSFPRNFRCCHTR